MNYGLPTRTGSRASSGKALVYVKGRGASALPEAKKVLNTRGVKCQKLYYSKHVQSEYKAMLEWCDFVVYLGYSETQWVALAQVWSMDSPTLVYGLRALPEYGVDAAHI